MITVALRQTGCTLAHYATWPEVFNSGWPIGAVGLWHGFIWVRTWSRDDADLMMAEARGLW